MGTNDVTTGYEQLSLGLRAPGSVLSVPEQIADRICTAILAGDLAPGQRIAEIPLAQSFNVSRGPVREALRILEHEGLVTFSPRRGAQVTALSADEVEQLFDIRAALLGLAAQQAARKISASDLAEFGRLVGVMETIVREGGDGQGYVAASARAGQVVARASDNPRLLMMIQSLSRQTLRYAQLGLSTPQRRAQSAEYWRALFEAIRAGDAETAGRLNVQAITLSRDAAVGALKGHRKEV